MDVKKGRCLCGAFESKRWPDETHLYAALLEIPADVTSQFHIHVAEKTLWCVQVGDAISRSR